MQVLRHAEVGPLSRTQLVRGIVPKHHDVPPKGYVALGVDRIEDNGDVPWLADGDAVDWNRVGKGGAL